MDKIGIRGDFFHAGNEYAIRHFSETDYCDDEVVHFKHREALRAYLMNRQKSLTTWIILNTVARCDAENLDYLCEKLHRQEWVLIVHKYHGIKNVTLEACCIEPTRKINNSITNSKIVSIRKWHIWAQAGVLADLKSSAAATPAVSNRLRPKPEPKAIISR